MHPASDARGVLYRGGPIFTVDARQPTVEAVATREGTIVAAGSEADCRRALGMPPHDGNDADHLGEDLAEPGPSTIDLDGRALLPGFIDAHLRPLTMCFFEIHLDLRHMRRLPDVLDALCDRARVTPPGEWVIGTRITGEQLAERRLPTIAELDGVGGGRPVVLLASDGHTSVGNSVALSAAGIRGNRLDPAGGAYERDASGRLTGVCHETATRVLMSAVPVPDLDKMKSGVQRAFGGLAANGVTSASLVLQTDAEGPAGPAGALESVGMMLFIDEVPIGCHAILCGEPTRTIDARTSSALHDPERNRVVGGVKLFLDGTLGARTACLHRPYADSPAARGWLTLDPAIAATRMQAIQQAGLQICVHAIGDAANDLALDLFTDLAKRHPPAPDSTVRHRIERATVLDERAADRFAELGLVAVTQPLSLCCEAGWLHDRLGPERARRTYPFRSLLDAGALVAGSSDAPIQEPDVLAGLTAAVTRHGFEPAQAMTVDEAIEAYTYSAACAQGREHLTGRIAEGLRADLVVLSGDPTTVPPSDIAGLDVELTVCGGQIVHRSNL